MNISKTGNYGKIIAFFLVASILLGAFGFAAEGWQSTPADSESDKTDEADQGAADQIPQSPPQESSPIYYYNPLTGEECSPIISSSRPIAFVIDSSSPIYGLSSSDILIELPIEGGTTRYLSITSDYRTPGKIGSIAPTRGFITNLSKYFGAILVSDGSDDTIEYTSHDHSKFQFDLTEVSGYHYTEYSHLRYTNGALIDAGIKNSGINSLIGEGASYPFNFDRENTSSETSGNGAGIITIPISSNSSTELFYSPDNQKYVLSKNGQTRIDLLTDSELTFDNAFILFADSITYESASGCELIMDTVTTGLGYYAHGGAIHSIIWSAEDGELVFYDQNGEKLIANCGTSYISIVKSSLINSVTFS